MRPTSALSGYATNAVTVTQALNMLQCLETAAKLLCIRGLHGPGGPSARPGPARTGRAGPRNCEKKTGRAGPGLILNGPGRAGPCFASTVYFDPHLYCNDTTIVTIDVNYARAKNKLCPC